MPSVEKYKTKKGAKFRVRWRVNGDQQSRSAGPLKATALKIAKTIEHQQLTAGILVQDITVNSCFRSYDFLCSKTKRPNTVQLIRHALRPFLEKFGDRTVSHIASTEIEQFKTALLGTRNQNGANIVIRNIKTMLAFALKQGYLEKNPATGIMQFEAKPVARFLSRKELARLLKAAPRKVRPAILWLAYTGMRRGEFLAFKPQDIKNDHIAIMETKTGRPRLIPLPERVARYVNLIGGWTLDGFESAFRMAVQRADMGRVRPHDLRHTFASAYLQSGGTLADLRELLGHKSIKMLEIYAHFQKSYLTERMNKVRL